MDYFANEVPFRKKNTVTDKNSFIKDKITQVENSIFRFSKKITQLSPSPSPAKKSDQPKPISLLEKVICSDHKISNRGIQIIKLPKLPFGRHANYNHENLFVTNHFILSEDSEKTKELDEVIKKFRLFEKRYNKSQRNSFEALNGFAYQKKNLMFKTNGGLLVCEKNERVLNQYDANRQQYANQKKFSIQTFRDIEGSPESFRLKRSNKSIEAITRRLYPTPEPSKSRLLNYLLPKYSSLFDIKPL